MKKYVIVLLSAISAMLVLGSTHSIFADEDVTDTHIDVPYVDAGKFFSGEDSKYQLHVQVTVRSSDNQLISVTESTGGLYLDHKITDKAFDTMLGEKEIVTINNAKYEKVAFSNSVKAMYFFDKESAMVGGLWIVQTCDPSFHEYGSECINFLQMRTNQLLLEDNDVIEISWTVLRAMN